MKKHLLKAITGVITSLLIFSVSLPTCASSMLEAAEERKSWEIQSNKIENWPEGPAIGAASAILMDADTGIVLYEKNASRLKIRSAGLSFRKNDVVLREPNIIPDDSL